MLAVVVVLLLAGLKMGSLYKRAYAPNIYPKNNEAAVVYIRTGVITSYSIHYTKLYDYEGMAAKQTAGTPRQTALRYADSAVSCMVQIQRQFPSEGSKLYLAEKGRKMNRTGLRLANRLYQETGRSTYAEQAFRYAEQGKYAVLSQLLASSPHSLHPAIPDSLKNRYADLNELIASLRYQLQFHPTSRDEGFSQNLRDSIFRCSQQLESLQNHMESTSYNFV